VSHFRQGNAAVGNAKMLAGKAAMHPQLTKASNLRKVSLNRLEKAIDQRLSEGGKLTSDMLYLAGLTSLEYVFFYPESGDIVIAGPAEPFAEGFTGHIVGTQTGKPVLALEDLVTALRCFPPSGEKTKVIGVSIDPTKEGLERMNKFLRSLSGRSIQPNDGYAIANGLKQNLGMQTVSIRGVPATTHFARVLVEADYRMKLIGIGLESPVIPLKSWIERSRGGGTASALQRWYFEADYSKVSTNEEGTALHLQGRGVKLTGEQEFVSKKGDRSRSGNLGDPASRGFTQEFTEKFEKLGEVIPVFGELRNLFDMAIAAAFIQERDLCTKAGWDLGVFADEDKFSVLGNPAITQVESAVNAVWRDGQLVTPIGGGVHIAARKLVSDGNVDVDKTIDGKGRSMAAPSDLAEGQWWWD